MANRDETSRAEAVSVRARLAAKKLREELKSESSVYELSDAVVMLMLELCEEAADECDRLQAEVDKRKKRFVISATRCWHYERSGGKCTACIVKKWCRTREAYVRTHQTTGG